VRQGSLKTAAQSANYQFATATPAACEWLTRKYPRALNWTIWDLPPLTELEAVVLAEKSQLNC
jgi:hypothetical protein